MKVRKEGQLTHRRTSVKTHSKKPTAPGKEQQVAAQERIPGSHRHLSRQLSQSGREQATGNQIGGCSNITLLRLTAGSLCTSLFPLSKVHHNGIGPMVGPTWMAFKCISFSPSYFFAWCCYTFFYEKTGFHGNQPLLGKEVVC